MTTATQTATHAAQALRDVAGSTVHTLTELVGDAQDRIEHLHLPALNVPTNDDGGPAEPDPRHTRSSRTVCVPGLRGDAAQPARAHLLAVACALATIAS